MKWFKDQIKKSVDRIVEFRVDKAVKELAKEDEILVGLEPVSEKLFNLAKFVNGTLTVMMKDGQILTKSDATKEDYEAVLKAKTLAEIFYVISSPEIAKAEETKQAEIAKIEAISSGIQILQSHEDFSFVNGSVYMKNIRRSLPQLLVERFAEIIGQKDDQKYQSLKKFWLKCCLNPNAQSAEDLYAFLQHHKFSIDNHGNFYAYRRVVSRQEAVDKDLVEFVANAYTKIKAVWKKKPSDYEVVNRPGTGYAFHHIDSAISGKLVGNLEKLYLELPNMQKKTYTSAHTGKEDYRVGEIMAMPRDDGDDNNGVSCSKGFHAASKAYDYSGFGDTPILVIINPMDVLAVPKGEWGKLRTCRWFFATTLPNDEAFILDDPDFDVSELGDIFEAKCAINLEDHVKNSFAEEVKRHTFTLSTVSTSEIKDIVSSLEEMREAISGRVKIMAD